MMKLCPKCEADTTGRIQCPACGHRDPKEVEAFIAYMDDLEYIAAQSLRDSGHLDDEGLKWLEAEEARRATKH